MYGNHRLFTFIELADHRCAIAAAWIGSAGDLGGCYDDSELGHSCQHHHSKISLNSAHQGVAGGCWVKGHHQLHSSGTA